jgi:hypothetical protein
MSLNLKSISTALKVLKQLFLFIKCSKSCYKLFFKIQIRKLLFYMRIANVTQYILILCLMYGCVRNICAYEFKIIHLIWKFQNFLV